MAQRVFRHITTRFRNLIRYSLSGGVIQGQLEKVKSWGGFFYQG
jgi:hypothetical protein